MELTMITALHVPSSNTFPMDRINSSQLSSNNQRNIQLQGKLPKFAPPARIDPFAANEVFRTNQPGTPNSFLETRSNSPARIGSPASAARFRMPPRSATTPHFHDRPPSPDMRMPQDSAFPVFPTKKVRQEQAKRNQQRSKSVSRSQSRDRATFRQGTNVAANSARSASPAVTQFPARPSTANSSSRKGSVSSLKSPADEAIFGGSPEPVPPIPTQHDTGGRGSPRLDGRSNFPFELPDNKTGASIGPTLPLESETLLQQQQQQQQQKSLESPNPSKQYAAAPAIKPLDAIGSTRKPNQDLSLNIPRGQGIAGSKINGTDRGRSLFAESTPTTILGPSDDLTAHNFTSEQHPPAHTRTHISANESSDEDRTEDSLGNLPSFGKSYDAGASTAPNRLRTSASSDGSQYSATHSVSSRSSPPTSASSLNTQDSIPKPDSIDNVLDEHPVNLRQSLSNEPTIPVITPSPAHAHPSPLQIRPRAPAKSFSRPNYIRPQLEAIGTGNIPAALASPRQSPYGQPVMPASQNESRGAHQQSLDTRILSQDERSSNTEPRSQAVMSPMSPADRPFSPMTPRTPQTPMNLRNGDISSHPLRRPTTPGFKGNCRGCGEMIVGKSVSSADGRLTGRYHKQCFVCQTCKEPFQTADFYVINNQPYCQRHYHTLNGSICENCDRGIEGPYMETDAQKKFHPHCFTCKECHLILRSDYFEINGVIYCEKHSRKPDLLGPGRRFPERRTTRLMMM